MRASYRSNVAILERLDITGSSRFYRDDRAHEEVQNGMRQYASTSRLAGSSASVSGAL